jgi:T-complex protein 1 subunit gamma
MSNQSPVIVLQQNMKRETGRKAQLSNIQAGKAVADIVRSTLGPRAMLKMILDAMGGMAITSDSNALLREIDVAHPAAKSMIDLSRAQDEEVGDGTTSVIVLAGEMLVVSEQFLVRNIHPKLITEGYMGALHDALRHVESLATTIDTTDRARMLELIGAAVGTKFSHRWGPLMCGLALDAVQTVTVARDGSQQEVDIKRYAKVEKLPGGELEDSEVLRGVMINKDIVHPRMRRRIQNPRVMLVDSPLEYRSASEVFFFFFFFILFLFFLFLSFSFYLFSM